MPDPIVSPPSPSHSDSSHAHPIEAPPPILDPAPWSRATSEIYQFGDSLEQTFTSNTNFRIKKENCNCIQIYVPIPTYTLYSDIIPEVTTHSISFSIRDSAVLIAGTLSHPITVNLSAWEVLPKEWFPAKGHIPGFAAGALLITLAKQTQKKWLQLFTYDGID